MASCLPIVFQLPIFWGLYASLRALSSVPGGPFQQGFLWLPSLGHPDPYHIMPFVAAFFQLIQTRMSMPTGKYKPTDPQQQMMSQMMQFLPLTVIIFGWSFPSGLVLYWATQSVFGAVQQYWITGWGALREWLPFLPEVVRYTPPDPEEIDESKVIVTESGEARPALKQGGFWGLISRQMEKVEQRGVAEPVEGKVVVKGSAARAESSNGRAEGQRPRVTVQNSAKGQRQTAALDADDVADTESDGEPARPASPAPRVAVRKSAATASNGPGGNGATAKRPPQRP
jgi:YidC/Oxa1 family membrane protein insertase